MAKFRLRVAGWRGFEVSCGGDVKTRVVFAVFDEDKTRLAWYLFASSPTNCAKGAAPTDKQFGHLYEFAAHNPLDSDHQVTPEKLLADPKGTPAVLDIEVEKRHINCDVSGLKTSGKDVVSFGATMLKDYEPGAVKQIKGVVELLEKGVFSEKNFAVGPQDKASLIKITGPVI